MNSTIVISDDEPTPVRSKRKSPHKDDGTVFFVPDGDYGDEIIFVEPEDYSPKKKLRLEEEKSKEQLQAIEQVDSEVAVTFNRKGIDFPHAREHCRSHSFLKITNSSQEPDKENASNNEKYCEKCYCFVCDELASKCKTWSKHCDAFAKNVKWEKERKMHKTNINLKSNPYISLLESLGSEYNCNPTSRLKITERSSEMFRVAANEIAEALLQDCGSSNSCTCICHYMRYSGSFCDACSWTHTHASGNSFLRKRQIEDKLRNLYYQAYSSAERYLAQNRPSCALVVLDIVTISLCSIDMPSISNRLDAREVSFTKLSPCWLEVCIDPKVDKTLLAKAKERLKQAASKNESMFSSEAQVLNGLVQNAFSMHDSTIQKCLDGKLTLVERLDIAKARVKFLKMEKLFTKAINYMLYVRAPDQRTSNLVHKHLCDFEETRIELIDFLTTERNLQEAYNVLVYPLHAELPTDLKTAIVQKDSKYAINYHNSVLKTLPLSVFKRLIIGTLNYKAQPTKDSSYDMYSRLLKVASLMLAALFIQNSSLHSMDAVTFYFDKFCSGQHKNYVYTSTVTAKAVQKRTFLLVKKSIKHCKRITLDNLKPYKEWNIPVEVFLTELLAVAVSVNKSMAEALRHLSKKGYLSICLQLITNLDLQNKIQCEEIKTFTKYVLPKAGSASVPLVLMEAWYNKLDKMNYFDILFDLARSILDEGKKISVEPLATETKQKAIALSKLLVKMVVVNSSLYSQSAVSSYLEKIDKKFSRDADLLGIKIKCTIQQAEMEFLQSPSFDRLEKIHKEFTDHSAWLAKRAELLQFLENSKFVDITIDIYTKLEMFDGLKTYLSNLKDVNFEQPLAQIRSILQGPFFNIYPKRNAFYGAITKFLSSALVFGSFSRNSFKTPSEPIKEYVKHAMLVLNHRSPKSFIDVMSSSMTEVSHLFSSNTVQQSKKIELEQWLKQMKELYTAVDKLNEWDTQFNFLLNMLKRKSHVVSYLQQRFCPLPKSLFNAGL